MKAPNIPSWLRNAVFYQVYPQSFADSNGDGIGDLPGLIGKLDYIRSLGATAIWLNPMFESPFRDAGYDISDFRKVAPRYGTNADAVRLFKEAHRRGMKVVLDLVAGHTSDRHPWFREAIRNRESPYRGHYIFTGRESQKPPFGETVPATPRGEHYVANFLPFQPALNFGYLNPDPKKPWQVPPEHPDCLAVRCELRDIMKYWLDLGCDGFRVDMASSLIKEDAGAVALQRLWQGFRAWFDRDYPEAALISEWSHPIQAIGAGFHIDFLIHFGEKAYLYLFGPGNELNGEGRIPHVFFEKAGEGDVRLFLDPYLKHYEATRGTGYIALPTGNHDFQRPRRGRDFADLKVAYTFLLTMPGVPFLYYGDEIGMRNLDGLREKEGSMWRTGNRTPMQWDNRLPNLGFSTAPAHELYLPVDPAPDAPTVAAQESDRDSLLNFSRSLIALRKKTPALGNDGDFHPLYADPASSLFVFCRSHAGKMFAVAVNSGKVPREANIPQLSGARCVFGGGASLRGTRLAVAGVSASVWRLA
jgi:maltose alpha-D-glucosyltransferase/alpha-amylase